MCKLWVIGSMLVLAYLVPDSVQFPQQSVISTMTGKVRGERSSCGLFCSFYSFKGIPYAAAPVGNLRFRAPVPHPGWQGVRPAKHFGSICPQLALGFFVAGDEDCLFLNVYTVDVFTPRPVMVFIHGGSYLDGASDLYGPDYFMRDGVVLVTLNYRLNIFGFLSTGDKYAQGNYGLKDVVLALRWVQDNIAAFGGDPDNVTVFGESAGASSVHFLILSSLATGLFHKAIAQSASVLCPWTLQPKPREIAFDLAASLNISASSTEQLINELRRIPAEDLITKLKESKPPYGMRPFDFVPSIEPGDSLEPILIPSNPFDILLSGEYNKVPLIMGYNNAEALFKIKSNFPEDIDQNHVPLLWNIPANSSQEAEIAQAFRNFYWGGKPFGDDVRYQYLEFASDHVFVYGIDKCVKLHANRQEENVYYYNFGFEGDLNLLKILFAVEKYPGATHADELFYLFSTDILPQVRPNNPAYRMRARMVRLWTNFAKYGDPTFKRDELVDVEWRPVRDNQEFLDISSELIPNTMPFSARLDLWKRLESKYANF